MSNLFRQIIFSSAVALLFFIASINFKTNNKKTQIINFIISLIPLAILIINFWPKDLLSLKNINITFFTYKKIGDQFPLDISFGITFAELTYLLILAILYPISIFYSIFYFKIKKEQFVSQPFHLYLFISILSGIFIITSKNLLISFLFYEILTIFTYFLVIYEKTDYAKKAGKVYFSILVFGSILFFTPAIMIFYDISHTLNFYESSKIIEAIPLSKFTINLIAILFIFGITKNALIPLHIWLVRAMGASIPVSALLHSVLVVKIGLFLTIKVLYYLIGCKILSQNIFTIFGQNWITIISLLTILTSAINAINSYNLKKRLAYSTIGQIGLIIFIASFFDGEMVKITGIMAINHALSKISLFFFVGEIYAKNNITTINGMVNVKRVNIFSVMYLIVSIFSLTGLPFSLGFYIKKSILTQGISAQNFMLTFTILISSILTFSYLKNFLITVNFSNIISLKKINSYSYMISLPGLTCAIINIAILINYSKLIKLFQ